MAKKIVKIFIAVLLLSLISCADCDSLAKAYSEDECLLIVERIPLQSENFFNYKGRHPITKTKCSCKSETSYRWWDIYEDKINIGDTIIKKKGELIFSIHKKDTILNFAWECDGKTYR
ncbi:hypothetical protein D3C87_172280 [compost metagenome]